MPRILFIGDIVGQPGRRCVSELLPVIRKRESIDIVIANGENAAAGQGITAALAEDLLKAGVDGITLGDHVWDQRGFAEALPKLEKVCRPFNLSPGCPGRGYLILESNGFRLGVCTMLGRNFMKVTADCPFRAADEWVREMSGQCDALFLEMHAETTSEKNAIGWYLDGRVAAVVGTHTHIPTADARVLPRGTAYMTDAGMTGPYASSLGREVQPVIARFIDGMPRRFDVASGDVRLSGAIIDIEGACASGITPVLESCED